MFTLCSSHQKMSIMLDFRLLALNIHKEKTCTVVLRERDPRSYDTLYLSFLEEFHVAMMPPKFYQN